MPVNDTLPGPESITGRFFPETGCTVRGNFLEFFQRFGLELCGLPLTDAITEDGLVTQYFQRLALEESPQGVRLKPLGSELLALRTELRRLRAQHTTVTIQDDVLLNPPPFLVTSLVGQLAVHPEEKYALRPLSQVRTLVIHHTGAAPETPPSVIAEHHVFRLGWPGIGYHFLVSTDGQIFQTNGLVVESFHARQFNATSIGIALAGNLNQDSPPASQLDALANLCAWLLDGLHLSPDAILGHRELVATPCPGENWMGGLNWKNSLLNRLDTLLHSPTTTHSLPPSPAPLTPQNWGEEKGAGASGGSHS